MLAGLSRQQTCKGLIRMDREDRRGSSMLSVSQPFFLSMSLGLFFFLVWLLWLIFMM